MSDISLLQLPLDVLVNIFQNLNYADLRNVMLTCRALRELILHDNYIWRLVSRRHLLVHSSISNSEPKQFSMYDICRLSHNWRKSIFRNKIVVAHKTNYMPQLKFHNSRVLFLTVGSELRCYPTDKKRFPNCRQTLWNLEVPTTKRGDIRTTDITKFVVKKDFLLCGNRDGCASLFKFTHLRHLPQLYKYIPDCHADGKVEVSAVGLLCSKQEPCVITASDCVPKIRFWCDDGTQADYMCIKEIDLEDNVGVRSMAVHEHEDKVALGINGSSWPHLLDVNTDQLLISCERSRRTNHVVRDIHWHNENTIMFCTHSGIIRLVDIRTNKVVYEAGDPFQSPIYCVKSDGRNAIVSGSAEYSRCVLYDNRAAYRYIQLYFTQKKASPVYSLDFDPTKLITAADRSVVVLNFNVAVSSVKSLDYSNCFNLLNT